MKAEVKKVLIELDTLPIEKKKQVAEILYQFITQDSVFFTPSLERIMKIIEESK